MSAEFSDAIYKRYLYKFDRSLNNKGHFQTVKSSAATNSVVSEAVATADINKGAALTSEGPAPYSGDILEDPDLLWTDDVWNEEREKEAKTKLAEQGGSVSAYWRTQYETKAGSFWHKFYKRNADHFYKDRHYLHIVFPELLRGVDDTSSPVEPLHLLEVGCGVGNAVLPLIEINPHIHVVAMDFAKSAIEILNKHPFVWSCIENDGLNTETVTTPSTTTDSITQEGLSNSTLTSSNITGSRYPKRRVRTSVRDIVNDPLPVPNGSMDLTLCMFVLSAIAPAEQIVAIKKIADGLKPGGKMLIRDYGRFDEAQLRFKKGSKIDDNFYVRQDGTCSYFFDLAELQALCESLGFRHEESHYVRRQYANRQQKVARHRVWIHAKFVKL
eukprot:gene11779-13672_t